MASSNEKTFQMEKCEKILLEKVMGNYGVHGFLQERLL